MGIFDVFVETENEKKLRKLKELETNLNQAVKNIEDGMDYSVVNNKTLFFDIMMSGRKSNTGSILATYYSNCGLVKEKIDKVQKNINNSLEKMEERIVSVQNSIKDYEDKVEKEKQEKQENKE